MGRTPTRRWGPRLIDVDILFLGDHTLDDPELTLPHKELFSRAFVLKPLAEIGADLTLDGMSIARAGRRGRGGWDRNLGGKSTDAR